MPEWQPLASAPKDGTWLIGISWLRYMDGVEMHWDAFPKIRLLWWDDGEGWEEDGYASKNKEPAGWLLIVTTLI